MPKLASKIWAKASLAKLYSSIDSQWLACLSVKRQGHCLPYLIEIRSVVPDHIGVPDVIVVAVGGHDHEPTWSVGELIKRIGRVIIN